MARPCRGRGLVIAPGRLTRDAGFILTFGATAALLERAARGAGVCLNALALDMLGATLRLPKGRRGWPRPPHGCWRRWLPACRVTALADRRLTFSRVTSAGLS